jgi:Uma2 family endonuclease
MDPARRRATYEDVLQSPPHKVAEVLAGELYLSPRPGGPHAAAATALGEELGPPFKRGRGGPGGWLIIDEPELHLDADVLVPDLGGWRRTTLARMPNAAYVETPPDWVCEVLSPSTERRDRAMKLPIYARHGVTHVWLINPLQRTLEVLQREGDKWLTLEVFQGEGRVRAVPFDAIELELAVLWADADVEPPS